LYNREVVVAIYVGFTLRDATEMTKNDRRSYSSARNFTKGNNNGHLK